MPKPLGYAALLSMLLLLHLTWQEPSGQGWEDALRGSLSRHLARAEASMNLALWLPAEQGARYQQQLAELEQQLAASRDTMGAARWQQHRATVLGQWRRDFFGQEQAQR
ncbi:hypothetical protein HB860_21120 [Aeromonas sp. 3925]|uniref:hypothetical protein n=1 Tax=Aeromonas genomosp. paramedia TaxID=3086176 RepID=UPI001FFDBE19|nr:hypothetical protein [Aeromonas genomosp. paramedia]MCK2086421.1 hypothetical protein [Aeromonas genomosp. paramedia]